MYSIWHVDCNECVVYEFCHLEVLTSLRTEASAWPDLVTNQVKTLS